MKDDIFNLCDRVREASFDLHRHLRHGHVEKVYENGLANRLRKLDLPFFVQHPLRVFDTDGAILGDFFADLFVDHRLIVELKACKALADEHTAQLLGYLRAGHIEHGMLINFGSPRIEIRKFALSDA
jgi:GxxExxY protein